MKAVFECQHSNAFSIGWVVNGTALNASPRRDIIQGFVDSDGLPVLRLTVLGLPEYNGITIQCVATFLDQSPDQRTPPVTLVIEGLLHALS